MADKYELGTAGPIPTVNPNVAKLADMLKAAKSYANQYYVKENVPLLGGTQLGDFLLGQAPEEVQRWGQGDYPLRDPREIVRTGGSYADVWKTGRFEPTFDVVTALPIAGGAKATKGMPIGAMMIGPESKLWKKEMEFAARKLEAKKASPEQIFEATGLVRGLDKEWRTELGDQFSKMKGKGRSFGEHYMEAKDIDPWSVFMNKAEQERYGRSPPELHKMTNKEFEAYKDFRLQTLEKHKELEQKPVTVGDVFQHDELMQAYPDLADIKITASGSPHFKGAVTYENGVPSIQINESLTPDQARSTMLHELQHVIQRKEGWGIGGNEGSYTQQADARIAQSALSVRQEAERMDNSIPFEQRVEQASELLNTLTSSDKFGGDVKKVALDTVNNPTNELENMGILYGTDKNIEPYSPRKMYENIAGEAEARLTQERRDLSDAERMAHFPYRFSQNKYENMEKLPNYYLDIKPEQAIVHGREPGVIEVGGKRISGEANPGIEGSIDYRGEHRAPIRNDYNAPGHELNKIYPDDIYGPKGHQYYGHGEGQMDKDTMQILNELRGNPNADLVVYRAVPNSVSDLAINPGDWVTPNLDYAHMHGKRFEDGYRVLEKRVPARHIYTDANSIHEFGYDPTE